MIVYIDVFVLKNLFFNMLIILLCGKILKQKIDMKRYLLASMFGTIYAVIVIISKNILLMSNFIKLLVAITMIFIAYPTIKITEIFDKYLVFIFITCYIAGSLMIMQSNRQFVNQFLVSCIAAIMLYIFVKIYNNKKMYDKYFCKIQINVDEFILKLNAFIDTGNTLRDKVSGECVLFVSTEELEKRFPENLIKILKSEVLEVNEKYYGRIKMISYQTINNDENILIGIKADNVIVENNDCIIRNDNIIIAPMERKLKNCEALIGMNILEEGYIWK